MKKYYYDGVQVTRGRFNLLTEGVRIRERETHTDEFERKVVRMVFADGGIGVTVTE